MQTAMGDASYHPREECRICGGRRLSVIVDLGLMPLANRFISPDDRAPEPRIPLVVMRCMDCANAQLSVVVDPALMFTTYAYRSGVSSTFIRHCDRFAREAEEIAGLPRGAPVLDIGGNDGTLLSSFAGRGYRTHLVDPAGNLAPTSRAAGHEVLSAFWGHEAAEKSARQWPCMELVTATNVVAHVDDLDEFFSAVARVLAPTGHFVLEVPYLADLVEKSEFDTIYHEHLSYFLLQPLLRLGERHGLRARYVRRIPIHGGGLRLYFGRGTYASDAVRAMLDFERDAGLHEEHPYRRFAREIDWIRGELRTALTRFREEGKRVAAYGASAKGAILLNAAQADSTLVQYIVDDTPEKQGHLAPGTRIPISPRSRLDTEPPDYLLILAWNFVDEIVEKTSAFSTRGGRYIIPVPALRIL